MVVLTSETVACELLKVTAVREPTSFLKLIHFIARDREVRRGFSLVEVTLAIAVVSFALTGVLALIPSGMLAIQSAVSSQATANIADQLRINPTSTLSGGDISFKANSAQNVLVTLSYPPSTWSKNYSFSLLVARSNL
jgi:prepilin-type N-terminal cleavage/methylation domain-containing protein